MCTLEYADAHTFRTRASLQEHIDCKHPVALITSAVVDTDVVFALGSAFIADGNLVSVAFPTDAALAHY